MRAAADGAADSNGAALEDDDDDDDKDEDQQAQEADAAAKLAELTSLTGQPKDIDELLYAIPVCAPYDTLQKYKYKVKIEPGGQKKGKASKLAADLLTRLPDANARCGSPLFPVVFMRVCLAPDCSHSAVLGIAI